ncbi:MAG TPA: DUF2167 domain-containing protein [Caulobacteraceae bacterium]|jgi:uncharacterized membrane-anchored protein|nr:DUF2167 domain-containing protein [Caulobacteraceae bacterium]
MVGLRGLLLALALGAASLAGTGALAQDKKPEAAAAAPAEPDYSWQDRLTQRTGVVPLPTAKASLNLGDDYYFLDAADSRKVLVDGWNNPPDAADGVLGMIFPKRFKPLDEGAWGAVVTYEATGYVADKDAKSTDYDKLLEEMRKGEDQSNAERSKAGFHTVHLVGWAEPPAYDASAHSVIWARDLLFSGAPAHTLNYDIRVLGRAGVISLNVVAGLSDLAEVRTAASRIGRIAAYDAGQRYADYQTGDKKAAYGVAGLIAAGVGAAALKKVGLLGLLLAFGKKAFVLIAAVGAAALAWLRRLFGGGKKTAPIVAGAEPPTPPEQGGGDIVT